MNYGMIFSEELQKQGARAVPNSKVLKELLRRGDYTAIWKGLTPANIDKMDNAYAAASKYGIKQRNGIMQRAKNDLDGYVVDLRRNTLPLIDASALTNAARRLHYNKSDILSGNIGVSPGLLKDYNNDINVLKSIIGAIQ